METTAAQQQHPGKATPNKGRGRPRASLACVSCRLRKVKVVQGPIQKATESKRQLTALQCNVQILASGTTCTPCESSSTKCVVDRRDDRRKGHGRYSFGRLQERVEKLEALWRENDGSPHQGPTPYQTNEEGRSSLIGKSRDVDPSFGGASNTDREQQPLEIHLDIESRNQGSNPHEVNEDQPTQHDTESLQPLLLVNSTGSANLEPASATAPTEDTTSCLDFDQSGGQPRYYGPSSRLYIHESSHDVQPPEEPEINRDFTIDIDSPQIQKQLLFLFWHVQVMPAATVDEEVFRAGRAVGGRSQSYSGFLLDTLLACGSRYSTSSTLRGLGEKYIERAKKEIAREIERPNLASLQGFLLLSDFEATQGRDRAGWIYCGTACRLLFDLGLHEDCSNLVKQGHLTVEDAGMRLNAFLVTFIFEKFWKLYLGRPSSVNEASLTAVRNSTKGMAVNPAVDAYVSLCVQVSSVTDFLNSAASSTSISDLKARTRELDAQLQQWYCEFSTSLKNWGLNSPDMEPAAYGFNMQFCGIRIVLHRMLGRLETESHDRTISGTHDPISADSNRIIHENAVQITRLIRTYRDIFGIYRVATIMLDNMYIAAQALIQSIISDESRTVPHSTDLQSVRVLAETMKDVVPHYPVTARMRSTLARLVESSASMKGMFGDHPHLSQPELPTAPTVDDDLSLAPGAWGTVDSFWNFDLADFGDINVDDLFSGN